MKHSLGILPSKFNSGFTLVEMVIYTGLLSVLLLVLTGIFVSILDVKSASETSSAITQDSRFILARFAHDIARSSSINGPVLGGEGSTLEMDIDGDTYTYSLINGELRLTDNFGTSSVNSSET